MFLDFDGTLAPIGACADDVSLTPACETLLLALTKKLALGPIIISGRDLDDLSKRIPDALYRIGNHGLRRALPGETPDVSEQHFPAILNAPLNDLIARFEGCFAERKSGVIAVHFRQAPDAAAPLKAALEQLPLRDHGYSLEAGNMIFELKPDGADKGAALSEVMAVYPALTPVMIGDDTTDEAAMAAAQQLGGFAIRVGPGETVADLRLDTPQDVENYLRDWMSE